MSNTKNFIDKFLDRLEPEDHVVLQDKLIEIQPLKAYSALKQEQTGLTMASEWIEEARKLESANGEIVGLKTGYESLDELTMGLKGGDLIVLAGQASHGKTLVGNNIAYRIAKAGDPVLFVTLEMTKAKVTKRLLNIADSDKTDLAELPIYYQEVEWVQAGDLYRLINRAVDDCGIKTVIIDHLHFLADRNSNDMKREIGSITKKMKQIAVELDMPIILLAQVKRLEDPKRKPFNQDLKETGYIEQDADIILMVWRDISIESTNPNAVEIYCTKNRDEGFTQERIKHFTQSGSTLHEFSTIADPFPH